MLGWLYYLQRKLFSLNDFVWMTVKTQYRRKLFLSKYIDLRCTHTHKRQTKINPMSKTLDLQRMNIRRKREHTPVVEHLSLITRCVFYAFAQHLIGMLHDMCSLSINAKTRVHIVSCTDNSWTWMNTNNSHQLPK